MRLGWSVLCRDYGRLDDGTVVLHRVFTDTVLELTLPQPGAAIVPLNPSFVLVSFWYRESESESRLFPAVLRVTTPDDNIVISEMQFDIDLRESHSSFATFQFRTFNYVSDGMYEFQIEVTEFADWAVTSHNSVEINGIVS